MLWIQTHILDLVLYFLLFVAALTIFQAWQQAKEEVEDRARKNRRLTPREHSLKLAEYLIRSGAVPTGKVLIITKEGLMLEVGKEN